MKRPSLNNFRGRSWALGNPDLPQQAEGVKSREWFAVTAFPLFAGTFGPIASALNLCSLVQPWKTTPPEIDGHDFPDPKWLISINAISIFFGVAANISIFLVVNDGRGFLTRNRHYFLALTIFGGMIASFILVALVIAARLRPWKPDHILTNDFEFTEAFWFAILSAGLYFITSGFIVYTAYMLRANTRSRREENRIQLAKGHHRLMVLTVLFMAYILAGAAVFSHIEGWRYLDGVYWADVTILTVGFGDFSPHTHLARSLLFPYAVGGIIILFLIIFCIPRLVLDQGKSLWEVHLRDKERLKKVRQLKKKRQQEKEQKVAATYGRLWRAKVRADKEKLDALHYKEAVRLVDTLKGRSKVVQEHEEREARREAFNHMQDVLVTSARKRLLYSLFVWGSSLLLVWLAGAMVFYFAEHTQNWSYFESVYFAFMSLLAIGYGDFTLRSPAGKTFFFLWSLIAVPTMTMLVSAVVDAAGNPYIVKKKDFIKSTLKQIGFRRSKENVQDESVADNEEQLFQDLPHNVHDKTHLLAETVKQVVQDHLNHQRNGEQPHYAFEYWEKILYLMGALEPNGGEEDAQNVKVGEDSQSIHMLRKRSSMDQWKNPKGMTDWLHGKNPLNATETLTEWLLVTLVDKLEAELLELRMKIGAVTDGLRKEEDIVDNC